MTKPLLIIFICITLSMVPMVTYAEHTVEEPEPVFDTRYLMEYDPAFFQIGGTRVRFNPHLHLKIGVVIINKSRMSIKEIIAVIFSVAPFDRYRDFFVFIDHDYVERGMRNNDFFIDAYDSYGRNVAGGFDVESSSVRAGLIVLRVDDYEFERTGTLGYAKEKLAVAQKLTILHELGHVLGHLGDEYSINESDRKHDAREVLDLIGPSYERGRHRAWFTEHANLEYRTRKILKWQPLIDQGILPDKRIKRIQLEKGTDVGRFLIPIDNCIMNRIIAADLGFCPVCQLQLIDSICQLSGAMPPWEEK